MLEDGTIYLAYAIALAIVVMVPGPSVIATLGKAIFVGARKTWPFILGIAVGDIVFMTVAVLGLAIIAAKFSMLFVLLKFAGGLYLLWMAAQLWGSRPHLTSAAGAHSRAKNETSVRSQFVAGLLLGMSNPKAIAFYTALVPSFVDMSQVGIFTWVILALINFGIVMVVLGSYAFLGERARNTVRSSRSLTIFNKIASGILGTAGLAMIIQTVVRKPA